MYRKINTIIGIIFLFASILLLFTVNWALDTFGLLTVEEIIYHFKSTMAGASMILVHDFINTCLLPTSIITILLVFITFFNPFKFEVKAKIELKEKKIFQIYPFVYIKKFFVFINMGIFLIILLTSSNRFGFTKYIIDQRTPSDFIEANYVDPKKTDLIFPSKKRNLIYIYMESLETTYFSNSLGGYQKTNLMPKLTSLTSGETNFSNTDLLGGALSSPGTSWTVAAMVAQTSGIPLKVEVDGNLYGSPDEFLMGAYTLGDILEKEGYNQMIMMGSDAVFGGRKYYFNLHGNYRIYDYYKAIENGKIASDYYVWWGFEDSKLYSYAKEELEKLSKEEEPFNFTLLTVDTHFPHGYLSESCQYQNKYDDNLSNVVACADDMLYDFVSWIKEQDFYKDTTVVIVGDHLSMDVDFFIDINNYDRTIYNLFMNSAVTTDNAKNRLFTTMDFFPTTLASMGVIIDGDKLGLGTNLFSNKKTLVEEFGMEHVREELNKRSDFYSNNILRPS